MGVSASLTSSGSVSGGDVAGNISSEFEGLQGSAHADDLNGNSANNFLDGSGGSDTIQGNGGDDTIVGGGSDDALTGGTGADRFVYQSMADLGDTILDFDVLEDRIVAADLFDDIGYLGADPVGDGVVGLGSVLN